MVSLTNASKTTRRVVIFRTTIGLKLSVSIMASVESRLKVMLFVTEFPGGMFSGMYGPSYSQLGISKNITFEQVDHANNFYFEGVISILKNIYDSRNFIFGPEEVTDLLYYPITLIVEERECFLSM